MSEQITLMIEQTGTMEITVDKAEYEAAKAARELDHFLDTYVSDMDTDVEVTEPDGTCFDPYSYQVVRPVERAGEEVATVESG
jgi:hypothetical protein